MVERLFGWIKDIPDSRDFEARRLIYQALPLPKKYTVWPDTVIYDQNGDPACSAFAATGCKTDQEFLQSKQRVNFDGLWLYNECKKIDGIPDTPGTYPRVVMKILQEQGCRQKGSLCFQKKPDSYWAIQAYYRMGPESTDEAIKQVLYQYGSIVAACLWFESWNNAKAVFPEPRGNNAGGHAFRIIGWDEIGWLVANSWGRLLWGVNGISTMPYKMFTKNVLPNGDIWKMVDK